MDFFAKRANERQVCERTDGRTDGRVDGRVDGRMDALAGELADGAGGN